MATVLDFLGYAVVTLFLILVCILMIAFILVVVIMCFVAIRNIWQEWRAEDG